jgi:hypothetical protein
MVDGRADVEARTDGFARVVAGQPVFTRDQGGGQGRRAERPDLEQERTGAVEPAIAEQVHDLAASGVQDQPERLDERPTRHRVWDHLELHRLPTGIEQDDRGVQGRPGVFGSGVPVGQSGAGQEQAAGVPGQAGGQVDAFPGVRGDAVARQEQGRHELADPDVDDGRDDLRVGDPLSQVQSDQ